MRRGPLIDWDWIYRHLDDIWARSIEHVQLTVVAVAVGLLIALPLGVIAYRYRRTYPPITWVTGLLYSIPSLALFAFLVPYTGFTFLTAEIGLVSYTLLILVRNTVAGLDSVSADVKEAARGMGLSSAQILRKVELPLALPIIIAGIRVATVTTIGLVTITALIGQGGYGAFILDGLRRFFSTPIMVGALLSIVLSVVADGSLLVAQRVLAPWSKSVVVN